MGANHEILRGGVPDERIVKFIKRHHVMSLATRSDEGLWCAALFYAYSADLQAFIFTSDPATRHAAEMKECARVAASIVLETRVVGRVQGLQIEGEATLAEGEEFAVAKGAYLKKFPYAAVAELHLWLLRPVQMKLTDNTLGFGRKLIWMADE